MTKKHMGSSIDFLEQEGIFEEAQAQAIKEVVAWQLAEAMKKRKISKTKWRPCLERAARRLIGCSILRMTSRFPACSGPRRWSGAGSRSN